jgi:hypothetical protein
MKNILRGFALSAIVLLMLATSAQTFAQQVRSRSLAPAFEFTNIQMPIEIVSIKLNGKEVQPGEKIEADDDWLLGLSFTLKNISDKPIAFIEIGLRFPQPNGFVVYSLNYGVDFSRGEPRREGSPPAIEPGETFNLALSKEKYPGFQRILALGGASKSFDSVPYHIARICFEGESDIIWEGGNLKRRDPNEFTKFNVIERYALPATRK